MFKPRKNSHFKSSLFALVATLSLLGSASYTGQLVASDESKAADENKAADALFLDLMTLQGKDGDFDAAFNNGKWTLVKIWQANCHVCGEQAPMISAAHDERDDFTAVGISVDGRKGLTVANRFVDRHEPSYPNFVGELSIIAVNFQILTEEAFRGTPSYLLFNPENELMAAQAGLISKEALFGFIDSKS